MSDELWTKMERVAASGHPRAAELREKAADLKKQTEAPVSEWNAKKLLGTWARARKVYTECLGVGLMDG